MVTYADLKKTGMAWALHDSEEVRLGYCFVLWLTSAGMAGDVPGLCGELVGRNYIFQSSIPFTTPYF